MLIYWIHLRQKGLWVSVESALSGAPSTAHVQRVTGVEGVLLEGKHWVVREAPPLTSPLLGQSEPAESGCVPCMLFSFLSQGDMLSCWVDLLW